MKKYIIILSLFLCACSKYRVYNLKTKTISIITDDIGYMYGDTILHNFKYSDNEGQGIYWKEEKCLILNKTKIWK